MLQLFLSSSATAQPLLPFSAKYSATLDLFIDLPVTAERELKALGEGRWIFSSIARTLVAEQQEESNLNFDGLTWQPEHYRFYRTVFGRSREIQIGFDPERNRVTTLAGGEPWNQPWETRVQDKLSYQLQLRSDLLAGRSELSYRIADGGQIKEYRFNRIRTERLTTPAGEFDCVVLELERVENQPQTLIWMAPELDYLTVRLIRTDEQGREHVLNLKEYEVL